MLYAVGIVLLVIGAAAGFPLGRALRARRERDYWIANVVAVLLAVLIAVIGQTFAVPYMAAGGIGLGFGLLTGMKYGLGAVTRITSPDGKP
jgi:hypothetical protein